MKLYNLATVLLLSVNYCYAVGFDINGQTGVNLNITTLSVPITTTPKITTVPSNTPIQPITIQPETTTATSVKPSTNATTPSAITVAPVNISTAAPATVQPPNPHNRDRKFDGPSFIGGIVLACGLTAIGFVGFKFYKARTERNYHTL